MSRKEDLIEALKKINFYWDELSRGRSEAELDRVVQELQTGRKIILGIFNYKIMGKAESEEK